MGITVAWYNTEQTIILRQMQGEWTWDDFHSSQSQINTMLKTVPHTVDQIIDTSKSTAIPPSALTHFRAANNNVPPNAGTRVVIGANAFYQMMFKILRNVFPRVTDNVILAANMEAALAQIAEKQAQRKKQSK